MQIIFLILTLVGAVPAIFFIMDRLRRGRYDLNANFKNAALTQLQSPGSPLMDGRWCIILYSLRIVNRNRKATTLKTVELTYRYGEKSHTSRPYSVISSPIRGEDSKAVALANNVDTLVLADWVDMNSKLSLHDPVPPDGVFTASGVFVLDADVIEPAQVESTVLRIEDYSQNVARCPIPEGSDLLDFSTKGLRLVNRRFQSDGGQGLKWL